MKLSTKARYGLRAAYTLAENFGGEPLNVATLAKRAVLPEPYLEKLLSLLKKAGVVDAVRGAGGGYQLSRDPSEVSVGEVLRALEGELFITDCVAGSCAEACPNKMVFTKLYTEMNKLLNDMTLEDMLNNKN